MMTLPRLTACALYGLLSIILLGCGAGESSPEGGSPTLTKNDPDPVSCAPAAGMQPVCGFKNAEDFVIVPDGKYLLVSEMGTFMSDKPGALSLLDIAAQRRQSITIDWDAGSVSGDRWGDPECPIPDPAKLSPHGIDLMTRTDGRHQLLVVNHGEEQVDFFELLNANDVWGLSWRGCAKPTADPFMNDVAGLNDGGFLVTHMWNKSMPFEEVVASLTAGEKIGWVWEWQRETGFAKLPNSVELMPNGIAVSADNSKIFVNIYFGNKTIKLDRASGEVEGEFSVKSPDNIVVDATGALWVASHLNEPVDGRCEDDHAGPCLLPFQVVKADPVTMQSEVVLKHEGQPMGYATVALPHDGRLYLGTASGDRLAHVALP
jgi:sugar lactone lactonase YvrE